MLTLARLFLNNYDIKPWIMYWSTLNYKWLHVIHFRSKLLEKKRMRRESLGTFGPNFLLSSVANLSLSFVNTGIMAESVCVVQTRISSIKWVKNSWKLQRCWINTSPKHRFRSEHCNVRICEYIFLFSWDNLSYFHVL